MLKQAKKARTELHAALETEQRELGEILQGRFAFREGLPVSKKSYYGSSTWDWSDSANLRLKIYNPSQLKIEWDCLLNERNLTPEIIEDLKKYAFMRHTYSRLVFPKTKRNAHPSSICHEVKSITSFLSHVR